MKTTMILIATLLCAVAGCASGPAAPVASGYDAEYMARVERVARASGVTVIWVNPPAKKAEFFAASGR